VTDELMAISISNWMRRVESEALIGCLFCLPASDTIQSSPTLEPE